MNLQNRLKEDSRFIHIEELKNLRHLYLFSNWVYIDWMANEQSLVKFHSPLNYDNYGFVKYTNGIYAYVTWEQEADIIPTFYIKGFYCGKENESK